MDQNTMYHHTRIYIDLRAYEQNLKTIASMLSSDSRLCVVLKADAYGHGIDRLAPVADAANIAAIAIAENWEAEVIRRLGIQRTLIRLRPSIPEEIHDGLSLRIEEIVGSLKQAQCLSRMASQLHIQIPVHLALDVGIGRMEFTFSLHQEEIRQVCALPGLEIRGVMTHFPCADEGDLAITESQWQRFHRECQLLQSCLPPKTMFHVANSATIVRMPQCHLDWVRLGIIAYGLSPSSSVALDRRLQPVMSVATHVMQVRDVPAGSTIGYGMTYKLERDSRIATLPIGYAHGYLRDFSNRADVLIRGQRCPVVGRISMNMVTVDVGHLGTVEAGDEVVLMGSQGDERISADWLADIAGTINYEITCVLGNMNKNDRVSISSPDSGFNILS